MKHVMIYLSMFILLSCFVSAGISDDLIIYYTSSDADTNATHCDDSSSSVNNAVYTGVTTGQPGIIDEAYLYDGDDYMQSQSVTGISGTDDRTINAWVNHTANDASNYIFCIGAASASDWFALLIDTGGELDFSGYADDYGSGDTLSLNEWHMVTAVYNGTHVKTYLDGSPTSTTDQAKSLTTTASKFTIGDRCDLATDNFDGHIDEVSIYDAVKTDADIVNLYNSGSGINPLDKIDTNLNMGIYDSSYNDISNTTLEGQEFIIWSNYSFEINGSSIHPNAWCNWSGVNVTQEDYDETSGTNLTVCGTACNSSNYTTVFSDMYDSDLNYDIYRYKLCRETSAQSNTFTIANNCSGIYESSYNLIPNCDVGYVNYSIIDANCTGDVTLSIWTDASPINKALVLVDSFSGVDRNYNASNVNMTWNSTRFVSEEHEYYDIGVHTIYVDCYTNLSKVENNSNSIDITVGNAAPTIFISDISDYFNGALSFTNFIDMRYPLRGFLNVTGGCQDQNLFNSGINLSYANGTGIYSEIFLAVNNIVPNSVNFTQGNFSLATTFLDSTTHYIFGGYCNDSSGNITHETRNFYAGNDAPICSWINSTPINTGELPVVINWTLTDYEGETLYVDVFVNGTLNHTGSNSTGFLFNATENTYNLSLVCNDSIRNSTQDDLSIAYTEACTPSISGIEPGFRYRSLEQNVVFSCSNGVAVTSCHASVNEFADETFTNCSNVTFTLERGWNRLNFTINKGGLLQGSITMNAFGYSQTGDFWDYPLLLYLTALCLLLFIASMYFGSQVGMGIFIVAGIRLAFEFLSLSILAGVIVAAIILFVGISALFSMKDSGIMGGDY